MGTTAVRWAGLAIIVAVLVGPAVADAATWPTEVAARLNALRVPFLENRGQSDARVAYYAPTFAGTVFVTRRGELVYELRSPRPQLRRAAPSDGAGGGWSLAETFPGGHPRPAANDRSGTSVSIFRGNDPTQWRAAVPAWDKVGLGEVWPGVTVSLVASGRSVEKVFTVAPGTSPDRIRVRLRGGRALSVTRDGELVARTGLGDVTFTAPVAYQERDGAREPVAVAYRVTRGAYRFVVGRYDRTRPLVIDPTVRSTYLGGGSDDAAFAVAIHPSTGDVYVAGATVSTNFPRTVGGLQPVSGGGVDAVVARLSSDLATLVQATYLGGGGDDLALALAIHPTTHEIYVGGYTGSTDFPHMSGGAQPTSGGTGDAFVARLGADLSALIQATYLGGSDVDVVYGLAINAVTNDVYVAGYTASANFPAVDGGAQPVSGGGGDAFIARLRSDLTTGSLLKATFLGGNDFEQANALAIHPTSGDVYVTGVTASTDLPHTAGGARPTSGGGDDAFVARYPATLTALTQATYLGGADTDVGYAVTIAAASGDVYVAGSTASSNFPGTAGAAQAAIGGLSDGFAARLTASLTSLVQATFLGGADTDVALAVAIHPANGNVYVAGGTSSSNFPGTGGSSQTAFGGGLSDGFAARLPASLTSLTRATYLGGADFDEALTVAIHPSTGDIYIAGAAASTNFPGTVSGAQASFGGGLYDGFVTRLAATLAPLATFADVPADHAFFAWIEALFASHITGGCGANPPQFCPDAQVTRGQMAVFLDRGIHGAAYSPPAASGLFADVPPGLVFAPWIEQLYTDGITGGCGTDPLRYCPDASVTRAQMAVFLLRAEHGAGYAPPPATGRFADVAVGTAFAPWIEQLAAEGITGGCATNPARYCPDSPVTRGQMAVFLVRAFNLPM